MNAWLFLCRPGFEADLAAELAASPGGYGKAPENSGVVHWQLPSPLTELPLFARSGFGVLDGFSNLPESDRVAALCHQLSGHQAGHLYLEHADTNDGRAMQRFLRGFRRPLELGLRQARVLVENNSRVLHLFFESSTTGWLGFSDVSLTPWENGIPRLRLPRAAPSRSALKIEEAWWRLMTEGERARWLRSGMQAADLGAAPGGWSWQLACRGMRVTAVDHGRLAASLEDEYPVTHVSADAFTWQPAARLDWVVCDIVDKPARTLSLMEKWLQQGWARAAVFNLKLPMKRRHREVASLLGRLRGALPEHRIRASQLYHDREEITVLVLPGSDA